MRNTFCFIVIFYNQLREKLSSKARSIQNNFLHVPVNDQFKILMIMSEQLVNTAEFLYILQLLREEQLFISKYHVIYTSFHLNNIIKGVTYKPKVRLGVTFSKIL